MLKGSRKAGAEGCLIAEQGRPLPASVSARLSGMYIYK